MPHSALRPLLLLLSHAAYVQTSRALMVCACLLGLPALLLVLVSMPCIRLHNDSASIKQCRARTGGLLFIPMGEEADLHVSAKSSNNIVPPPLVCLYVCVL